MAADPLDFGVDIASVRQRLEGLGYFLSVTDTLEGSMAINGNLPASPPAAFIAIESERAERNKTIQGHRQRVAVVLTILFVEQGARFDAGAKDRMEQTRKAITRILLAWRPDGAAEALDYARYRIVTIQDGLVWGEVSFTTSYFLTA
jgi:hypothetical protein